MQATRKRYLVSARRKLPGIKRPTIDPVVVTSTDPLDAVRVGRELMGFNPWVTIGPEATAYDFAAHRIPTGSAVFTVTAKKVHSGCRGPETDSLPVSAADETEAIAKGKQTMGLLAFEQYYEFSATRIQEQP